MGFRLLRCSAVAAVVLAGGWVSPTFGAAEEGGLPVGDGKLFVDLRYRFERVDDDAFAEKAEASTVRLRLGYRTGGLLGFSLFTEFEAVEPLGGERYDSTANGKTQFPVVADPEETEVNQAYLQHSGWRCGTFRLGRQRITLDNQRFIGNVGWRQNEQTYDAFSARIELTERASVFYGHLINANRVFGEHHPIPTFADTDLDADLGNFSYRFPSGTLAAYVYLLELEDTPLASHQSIGLRFGGKRDLTQAFSVFYAAEAAWQDDYADGAATVDADYRMAEVGIERGPLAFRLGFERLGGDGTYGFSTPLATLHAFNGWADKFLATPPAGLEDRWASLSGRVAGIALKAVYHDFRADAGGADYGTEIDLQAKRSLGEKASILLVYSGYDADGFSTDTNKLWLQLGFSL